MTKSQWASKRCTDPLNPVYVYRDSVDGTFDQSRRTGYAAANMSYGFIPGSKPAKTGTKMQPHRRALDNDDIAGTKANSKNAGPFTWVQRKDVREVNKTDDITGAAPDTLKKAPVTNRSLNPLNPTYQYPGASEAPIDNLNDPFGAKASSMGPANFKKCKEQGVEALRASADRAAATETVNPVQQPARTSKTSQVSKRSMLPPL